MTRPIAAPRTALLVIDMQLFFLDTRFWAGVDAGVAILPAVNRLADALRDAGGTVIWIVTDGSESASADWTVYRERLGEAAWRHRVDALSPGGPGAALHPELAPDENDVRFVKTRFSAFVHAPLDLDRLLRERGIDTLLVTGVTTDVCCESTARDAMMRNYRVIVVEDALAATTPEVHAAALEALCPRFADRATTAQTVARIGPH